MNSSGRASSSLRTGANASVSAESSVTVAAGMNGFLRRTKGKVQDVAQAGLAGVGGPAHDADQGDPILVGSLVGEEVDGAGGEATGREPFGRGSRLDPGEQHEIAQPREPHQRLGAATKCRHDPAKLGEGARYQGGTRGGTETGAVQTPEAI